MKRFKLSSWSLLPVVLASILSSSFAQQIMVDITPGHETNRFIPTQTLGAGVDRIPKAAIDKDLVEPNLGRALSSGWQPVTYRQNTELAVEAWHWNSAGTWSEPGEKGYFTSSTALGEPIRYSYGYPLPHRGFTRNDGTGNAGYSRLTDGDPASFWKSNPYLTQRFTSEDDSLHPQWIVLDFSQLQLMDSIKIDWAAPYATEYLVQYWTGEDPIRFPTRGVWQTFPHGSLSSAKGGTPSLRLTDAPISVRYVRILMTHSSNTCDSLASSSRDPRNCVGYAIHEIYAGTLTADGKLHDIIRHTADQEQTTTYCSSVDPWHESTEPISPTQAQVGFDVFYTSGVTRGLPAMMPVSMLYDTPENAAAEITYLKKRNYPISYIELGEEADGQYMLPEDYAALYLQWATALHRIDPSLKLGGPAFQGVNRDIQVWPDARGNVSWLGRFLDYLNAHNRMNDLAFFSFEHYPYDPCRVPWGSLYDEPELMTHIMQVWREDGLPANVPMFVTESNLSSSASETYMDIFSGLWLGDYIGSFLTAGGKGVYYFHYLPLPMEHGCNDSPGTFGMFTMTTDYQIQQELSQFFTAQLINLQWVQPGSGEHIVYSAKSDIDEGAGHALVTAYAVKRPDGEYALMVVNRDQENPHQVRIIFEGAAGARTSFSGTVSISTFGRDQYHWYPATTRFMAHAEHPAEPSVVAETRGHADPDGPIATITQASDSNTLYNLPAASVTVFRGNLSQNGAAKPK